MIINSQFDGARRDFVSSTSLSTSFVKFTLKDRPKYFYLYCTAFTYPSSAPSRVIVSADGTLSSNTLYATTSAGRIYVNSDVLTTTYTESTKQLTITRKSSTYGQFNTDLDSYKLVYYY